MKTKAPSKNAYDDHKKASADRPYATVLTVDPVRQTATVLTSDNRLLRDLVIIKDVGNDGGGDFSTPEPGWYAVLSDELGMQGISYCFPPASYFSEGRPPEYDDYAKVMNTFLSLTGAPGPYRHVEGGNKNFRAHRPYDLIAGDRGFRTSEGASVFALRGGVAGMKVSDLCQLILNQVDDLARLVARNFEVMTDWGSIQILNENGKTKLQVKANRVAKNTYEDRHEFSLVVGNGEGTAFIDMVLLSKDGAAPVAVLKMDQEGTRYQFLANDDLQEVRGNQGHTVVGNQKEIVGGEQDIEVDGRHRLKCDNVNLGDFGGQKAPMGEELYDYLRALTFFLRTQVVLISPVGLTIPGSVPFGPPEVPDFLSRVVHYTKFPAE